MGRRCRTDTVRLVSILAAVTIAAAVAVPAAAPKGPMLLGIVGKQVLYQQLAHIDYTTLRPLPGSVPLAAHRIGWSFSPDNATLVLGNDNQSCAGGSTTLRFVDLAGMKVLGDVPVVKNGPITATAWLDRDHVVAVAAAGDCIGQTKTVVASIDAKQDGGRWKVYVKGGRERTELDAVEWAKECVRRGAGEILLTSIDRDGARIGYDLELTRAVADAVPVPVIVAVLVPRRGRGRCILDGCGLGVGGVGGVVDVPEGDPLGIGDPGAVLVFGAEGGRAAVEPAEPRRHAHRDILG